MSALTAPTRMQDWTCDMGLYFDDIHEVKESQLGNAPVTVGDTDAIKALRALSETEETLAKLEQALYKQLRFKECIEILTKLMALCPDNEEYIRKRAGRYLSILRHDKAIWDFLTCLSRGGDKLDIYYRMGLCRFFEGNCESALALFEDAFNLADDEMGIAAMYWHTLACAKSGHFKILLMRYSPDMQTGHHTAYDLAMSVWAGYTTPEDALLKLADEPDDMEYDIAAYGIAYYLKINGDTERYNRLMQNILSRDDLWNCFAYLAAYNDINKKAATD